jgi:hypothetical protein
MQSNLRERADLRCIEVQIPEPLAALATPVQATWHDRDTTAERASTHNGAIS